jgi:hypothetical protein
MPPSGGDMFLFGGRQGARSQREWRSESLPIGAGCNQDEAQCSLDLARSPPPASPWAGAVG